MIDGPAEILPGLWQFSVEHPEWTPEEGGQEGWDPAVSWWATRTSRGLLLIDPLLEDWTDLDRLVGAHDGCSGIVRTCHWHARSVADAAARYEAAIWAAAGDDEEPVDYVLNGGVELWDGIRAFAMERDDEIALWLPEAAALVFGDALIRGDSGRLRICPDSWTQPAGGRQRLRALLRDLVGLPAEHVLVSHGPPVLGDGTESLRAVVG